MQKTTSFATVLTFLGFLCFVSTMTIGSTMANATPNFEENFIAQTGAETLVAENRFLGTQDLDGEIVKVIDGAGHAIAVRRPDGTLAHLPDESPSRILDLLARTSTEPTYTADPLTIAGIETFVHKDPAADLYIDEYGRAHTMDGRPIESQEMPASRMTDPADSALAAGSVTIDWMSTGNSYSSTYQPAGTLGLIGRAQTYYLSDETNWRSGAGSFRLTKVLLDRVEVSEDTVRYILQPPADGILYQQTDYDSGNHSAQGTLGVAGSLEIEAVLGSTTAVMRGQAEIISNFSTWYGEPKFNYYSSIVGAIVPFEVTYTITTGSWTADTFDSTFSYQYSGMVDFANPVSLPQLVGLEINGSAKVPDESSTPYNAVAHYENGVLKNVTDETVWEVQPTNIAIIDQGLVTTQKIDTEQEPLTIYAEYTEDETLVKADKTVLCVADGTADLPYQWETYQANSSHTGYIPISLEPEVFSERWQQVVGSGKALNPVTAADGKVLVSSLVYRNDIPSLFVLDARDGEILWSKNFGSVYSVNPPAYAYGNVYIQTGNHSRDTYLHAYDADTGQLIFKSAHSAQWERYYAPTIHNGNVFINGGYTGGMYAFDAYSGELQWFHDLPQYDEWTPAVDKEQNLVYAYAGAGLYAVDRFTGEREYMIPDLNFDWNGWSMNLAPMLGNQNDVVAIHNQRLISFNIDIASPSIRWEVQSKFSGQPSIAHDAIYAIDDGELVVLNEDEGTELWRWQPPEGRLRGSMIVTDTHLLASTESNIYAVELLSKNDVWSYPVAGHLALGNDTLYIASKDGTLTAISVPEYIPADPLRLEITGPREVVENSSAQFTANVHYTDGRVRDRSDLVKWQVEPAANASFDAHGLMTTTELFTPREALVVKATYTERSVTVKAEIQVDLVIGVSLKQFIERNISGAKEIKQQVLQQLEIAQVRERAAREVLRDLRGGDSDETGTEQLPNDRSSVGRILMHLNHAIYQGSWGKRKLRLSVDRLLKSLAALQNSAVATNQLTHQYKVLREAVDNSAN